LTYSVW